MADKIKRFSGRNILIVDDEPTLREILREEFEYEGATVHEAPNGKTALEHLKLNPCDLVVSDIRMPGGDGVGLLRGINENKISVPVFLFMSGFSDLTIDEAYDLGAAAILAKPFNIESILENAEANLVPQGEKFQQPVKEKPQVGISKHLLKTLEQALAEGEISIGKSGLFVRGSGFKQGTTCHFKITFESGDFSIFEGDGMIRWSRTEETAELPAGIGIEFRSLPESTREKVLSIIQANRSTQFIPKK